MNENNKKLWTKAECQIYRLSSKDIVTRSKYEGEMDTSASNSTNTNSASW